MIHDQASPALTRQICPHPLHEDADAETRLGQELEMYRRPREPREKTAEAQSAGLQDGEPFADDCQRALIEVAERARRRVPADAPVNHYPRMATLLHRHLRDAGRRSPVLI